MIDDDDRDELAAHLVDDGTISDDTRCQNCQDSGCSDGYFEEWVPYGPGMTPMPVRCDCEQEDCSCHQALADEEA